MTANVVFIITDDEAWNVCTDRHDDGSPVRPLFQQHMLDAGCHFTRGYYPLSLCEPSRTSVQTGQYPSNNGVSQNAIPGVDDHDHWVQQWLGGSHTAGTQGSGAYQTGLVGKWRNSYAGSLSAANTNPVPSGWDEWHAITTGEKYYGPFRTKDLGTAPLTTVSGGSASGYTAETLWDSTVYSTLLYRQRALDMLDWFTSSSNSQHTKPFFLYVAPYAPHFPAVYPAGDTDARVSAAAWNPAVPPSVNEADVSDKPAWIQALPAAKTTAAYTNARRAQARLLWPVDQMIADIVAKLTAKGILNNTYIFYMSDNGTTNGEHRLTAKDNIYDACQKMPLVVRGPGITGGTTCDALVSNIDIAPTIANIAGVSTGTPGSLPVDGVNILPALSDPSPFAARAVQMYLYGDRAQGGHEAFGCITATGWKYVEWHLGTTTTWSSGTAYTVGQTVSHLGSPYTAKQAGTNKTPWQYPDYWRFDGPAEIYDHNTDPYELTNLAYPGSLGYLAPDDPIRQQLAVVSASLRACSGSSCSVSFTQGGGGGGGGSVTVTKYRTYRTAPDGGVVEVTSKRRSAGSVTASVVVDSPDTATAPGVYVKPQE